MSQLSIGLRHAKGAALYEDLPAYLPFDEAAGSTNVFDNLGSLSQPGYCQGTGCPATGEAGMVDGAVTFDGTDDSVTLGSVALGRPVTFAAWVRPDAIDGTRTIFFHGVGGTGAENEPASLTLRIKDGQYQAGMVDLIYGNDLATYDVPVGDVGSWVHLAGVWTDDGCWYLYRNGELVGIGYACRQSTDSRKVPLTMGAEGAVPTNFFQGALDEVVVYDRALTSYEIEALADTQRWRDADLAEPGAPASGWTFDMAGLEGPYQVDLKVTDGFGRTRLIPNVWSGEIDTAPPQVCISVQGYSWTSSRLIYWLSVSDYNLLGHTLTDVKGTDRTYTDTEAYIDEPWYTAIYSQTRLVALSPIGRGLEASSAPYTLTACDIFGQCASVSAGPGGVIAPQTAVAPQTASSWLSRGRYARGWGGARALGTPVPCQSAAQSAVLSPPDGMAYATLDPIEITGHAYAPEALRALTVTVNSVPISTTTWATADVTETLWTTSWTPPGDGVYTITAQIADWAGGTTTETVPAPAITVDTVPPAVLLTTDVISSADFTGAGYVTVRGLVTDTFGVAALQVRYDDGPWTDAEVPTPPMPSPGRPGPGATFRRTATWQRCTHGLRILPETRPRRADGLGGCPAAGARDGHAVIPQRVERSDRDHAGRDDPRRPGADAGHRLDGKYESGCHGLPCRLDDVRRSRRFADHVRPGGRVTPAGGGGGAAPLRPRRRRGRLRQPDGADGGAGDGRLRADARLCAFVR